MNPDADRAPETQAHREADAHQKAQRRPPAPCPPPHPLPYSHNAAGRGWGRAGILSEGGRESLSLSPGHALTRPRRSAETVLPRRTG